MRKGNSTARHGGSSNRAHDRNHLLSGSLPYRLMARSRLIDYQCRNRVAPENNTDHTVETSPMLRFFPRYGIVAPALVAASRQTPRRAANDNAAGRAAGGRANPALADPRVQAALRLFARHGLSAAEHARFQAANADAHGHDRDARWWHDISTMLGQRAAGARGLRLGHRQS